MFYQNNWSANYFDKNMMEDSKLSRFRLGMRLTVLARRWRQALDERLATVGFSDATWTPLSYLARYGDDVSQKELAERMQIDTSSLVRLLDILEAKGEIERRPDPEDRRAKRLFLTAGGRTAFNALDQRLGMLEAAMLSDITDVEVESLLSVFERIEVRLRNMPKGQEQ